MLGKAIRQQVGFSKNVAKEAWLELTLHFQNSSKKIFKLTARNIIVIRKLNSL